MEPAARYWSPEETAVYLGVSRWTLYKPVWKERLGAKKLGSLIKFDRVCIERYMKSHVWTNIFEKCGEIVGASYNPTHGNPKEVE